MGILIDFYAGDAAAVARELGEGESPKGVVAHADFSLHIDPSAIDLLCEKMGVPALLDSIERELGYDGGESAASLVSPKWVAAVGAIPPAGAGELAQEWLRAVNDEYGGGATDDAGHASQAVRELIALCRTAAEKRCDVVFAWSL